MFETILSSVTAAVRSAVRTADRTIRKSPWVAPIAILALFFLL